MLLSLTAPRRVSKLLWPLGLIFCLLGVALAHPLGNFTINHFMRINAGADQAQIRYVIDLAEIPTFQELQKADLNQDGTFSADEQQAYLAQVTATYLAGLKLTADGAAVPLQLNDQRLNLQQGEAGLMVMRLIYELTAQWPVTSSAARLRFENANLPERAGWRELIVTPAAGVQIFDSTLYGNGVTDELKAYPEDLLMAPLNERSGEWSATRGVLPANAQPLTMRDGNPVIVRRDRFAELIAVPQLTPGVILLGLLLAFVLGAAHALEPGHGKTVVGAYLVGTRGTPKHALFLGLTVTITHTLGVFALGLVTLFASRYVLPDKLFPILSFISGALVLGIGANIFIKRLRGLLGAGAEHDHHHGHTHDHDHGHTHDHHHHGHDHAHAASGHDHLHNAPSNSRHDHHEPQHVHAHASALHHSHLRAHEHGHEHHHDHAHNQHYDHTHEHHGHAHTHNHHEHSHNPQHGHTHEQLPPGWHSHGGVAHSHLPPGADGTPVTWRSLLGLGVSGGLLPCPSALVLMLGAISLNRVGYGLVLTVAFSLGLAAVLTGIGLAFVYGGKLLNKIPSSGKWTRVLPAVSAFIITVLGAIICYQALQQAGFNLSDLWHGELETSGQTSAAAILSLGLFIGLRHALDTDHLAAVSTIVSERRSLFSSLLVGGLWGIGHTVSLLLAGVAVILLNLQIEKYEKPLEFGVALMLIGLGAHVLYKLVRGGRVHFHQHTHGGHTHVHPHLHDGASEPPHSHHGLKLGMRPLIIGMVHGLAGSAALMLAVLATIKSTPLAFAYIIIFGLGSIGGMMIMSLLLSLPMHFTADYFARTNWIVRALAGCFSLGFGLFMVYEIGFVEGLLR
jgi:nickel/cobalt transporter (NicO) family protein